MVDVGFADVRGQGLALKFKLLDHFHAHVAAPEEIEDVQQARQRGPRAQLGGVVGVKTGLLVEKFYPEEGSYSFREGMLKLQ